MKKMSRIVPFWSWLLALPWLLLAPLQAAEVGGVTVQADYRVQPGDVLFVSVWDEEQLQREVVVRPDGSFAFPLVGDVQAAGRSVDQIRADITRRLQKYIPEAAVTVSVKKIAGNKIFVLGQVKRPGEFVINANTDVMQALSMAGGVTPFADLDGIKILRRDRVTGQQKAIPFNYKQILKGRHLEQNILLQSGDTVLVP